MWPRDFRKKKPYTADELSGGGCEDVAKKIKKARGSGQIIHIAPPDQEHMLLGPVRPPGGGVINNWRYHEAVRDGDRIYDKMTLREGMTFDEYKLLFDYWDLLVISIVEDE
jgi:hypothetical protein